MKILAFINQKGGTGKTTTALNVGAALARKGYKVLLIDADAQGNLTTCAGYQIEDSDQTLYEILKGQADINDTIKAGAAYDVIPTDIRLSAADLELAGVAGRELLLKEAIAELKRPYDFILIDCPPSLSIIPLMALAACDKVIIPVQAAYLPLNGLAQLTDTIALVKKRLNKGIEIGGIVVTMYSRKNLAAEVAESIREAFPDKIFNTTIPDNVALAEAPAAGKDIFEYQPTSKGAAAYAALAEEIIKRA